MANNDNLGQPFPTEEPPRSSAWDNWNQPHPGPAAPPQAGWQPEQQWYGQQPEEPRWPSQNAAAFPPPAPIPPGRKRLPAILTAALVALALLAGFGVWMFAHRDTASTAAGQSTPEAAVTGMLASLAQQDSIGAAARLDPTEATLFTDFDKSALDELKRLQIIKPGTPANSTSGGTVTITGVTFDTAAQETVNDHETIVKLTGGVITVTSDPSKAALTDKIKQAAGSRLAQLTPKTQTYNVADLVKQTGGPIRIATVKRGGTWYPSVLYSIADNAAHAAKLGNPTAADYIAPAGAVSPEAAMNTLLDKISTQDLAGVIALLPPDEMGVAHDYGKLLARQAGKPTKATFTVTDANWNITDVSRGKKVSLKDLTVTAGGQTYVIKRNITSGALSITSSASPTPIVIDRAYLEKSASKLGGSKIAPQLLIIIGDEFTELSGVGVVTTEVGGRWYVSPLRSSMDVFVSLLKGLNPADIDYLLSLTK